MALRAWRVWGVSAVLAGGVVALAQSPKSEVSGRATPALTQDHFQPESAPPPRVMPQQVRETVPSKTPPPTARGEVWDVSWSATEDGEAGWKARLALDIAEMHFDACEIEDSRRWYGEVIRLAPGTAEAGFATKRLIQALSVPAGGETREPPLADRGTAGRDIPIP